MRFHSPLNLQVLAFPLAASSCCAIEQNIGIKTTACLFEMLKYWIVLFEMLKYWIVFYHFYGRVKNFSVVLTFIRCWWETGLLTVTQIFMGFSSLPLWDLGLHTVYNHKKCVNTEIPENQEAQRELNPIFQLHFISFITEWRISVYGRQGSWQTPNTPGFSHPLWDFFGLHTVCNTKSV